jgi:hypothetical protein
MQVKLLEPAECWFGSPKAMENSQIPADGCRDLTQIPFWERISFLGGDFGHQNPKWGKLLGQVSESPLGRAAIRSFVYSSQTGPFRFERTP